MVCHGAIQVACAPRLCLLLTCFNNKDHSHVTSYRSIAWKCLLFDIDTYDTQPKGKFYLKHEQNKCKKIVCSEIDGWYVDRKSKLSHFRKIIIRDLDETLRAFLGYKH